MTQKWNDELSGEHLKIASSTSKRIAILAGPGTGKTKYGLLRRIMRLLQESKVDPEKILFLTFTRTAAEDFINKLDKAEIPNFEKIDAATVHSFCLKILDQQNFFNITGRHSNRLVMDFETKMMLYDISDEFGTLTERKKLLNSYTNGWAKGASDYPGNPNNDRERKFQEQINNWLLSHKAMLIGEVVPLAYKYLSANPNSEIINKYSHIIIDEYQDLNKTEQELVEVLVGENGSICVAGDDNQSIYSFRCANPQGILDFFNSANEKINIDTCGRCPKPILDIANKIKETITLDSTKPMKCKDASLPGSVSCIQWKTSDDESAGIATLIKKDIDGGKYNPGDYLILIQSKKLGKNIRNSIRDLGIECHSYFQEDPVGGVAGEKALTIMQLLVNPSDSVSLRYWLGAGNSSGNKDSYNKLSTIAQNEHVSVYEILESTYAGKQKYTGIATMTKRYHELKTIISNLSGKEPLEVINILLPDGNEELEDLRSLAQTYLPESETVENILNKIKKAITQPDVPQEPDFVRVMSFHKSKGLTSNVTILAGVVQGLFPKSTAVTEEIQESKRLFYVGVTRAQKELIISSFAEATYATISNLLIPNGGYKETIGGVKYFNTVTSTFISDIAAVCPKTMQANKWLDSRYSTSI